MSTVKTVKYQVGTDGTSTNNFTIYQPDPPDGTMRVGVGNADSPTDVMTVNSSGITMASGKTIPASALTGALPAIDGSALTGISSYANSDALTLFNASGSAPVYACRAWVSLNGTGTIAIRASGNVSSIVDVGTGRYTVNLTTAIQDVNYAVTVGGSVLATETSNEKTFNASNIATSSFMIHSHDSTSNAYADSINVFGAVFR